MTETVPLSPEQHDIYVHVMKNAAISPEANVKNCQVDGAVTEDHLVAFAEVTDPNVSGYAIVTLPNISNQVYLLLCDNKPELFCSLIAQFDAESESNDSLSYGHLSKLADPFYQDMGWHGTVICRVASSFNKFPRKSILNDDSFEFHQVVLLNQFEFEYANQKGADSLITLFLENRRPLNLTKPDNQTLSSAKPAKPTSSKQAKRESDTQQKQKQRQKQTIEARPEEPSSDSGSSEVEESTLNIPDHSSASSMPHRAHNPFNEKERVAHFSEIAIGSLLILAGLIISAILFKFQFTGSSLFPIFFTVIGVITLYSTLKDLKDKQR